MSMITLATAIGNRPYNEDRILCQRVPGGTLLGVFDGHGGDEVAVLLVNQMPKMWSAIDGDAYGEALRHVFAMSHAVTQPYACGSTATAVFIPTDESVAYIAVLGDSPVIVDRPDGNLFVGPEHNVRSNLEERSAAIARGGIYYGGWIWNDMGDLGQGLQMSRAFGDAALDKILDRTPEIFRVPLGRFLLLATDGVMDPTHRSREAYDDVLACIRNDQTAGQIVDQAVALPTNDNATAILWRR